MIQRKIFSRPPDERPGGEISSALWQDPVALELAGLEWLEAHRIEGRVIVRVTGPDRGRRPLGGAVYVRGYSGRLRATTRTWTRDGDGGFSAMVEYEIEGREDEQ